MNNYQAVLSLMIALVFFQENAFADQAVLRHENRHRFSNNDAVVGLVEKIGSRSWIASKPRLERRELVLSTRVFEGDQLSTSENGKVHVRFKDGTYFEIAANSLLSIERIRFKPGNLIPEYQIVDDFDESVFRFEHGVVRITASEVHSIHHFTVRAVQSTIKALEPVDFYIIGQKDDRDLVVRVLTGKIHLMNIVTNQSMVVSAGQSARVTITGLVASMGNFTEEQKSFLQLRTRL